MYKGITTSRKRFNQYAKVGNRLIKKNLTSGFQIEDYNPLASKSRLVYGHDSPAHVNTIRRQVGGRKYPRVSFYKWNPTWTAGENTELLDNGTLAFEQGLYLETPNVRKGRTYIQRNAFNKFSKKPLPHSWDVPDVRVFGNNPHKNYKNAYLVSKNIDHNTRLATLVVRQNKLAGVRKSLKGERVERVRLQNYHPSNRDDSNSSFWKFIYRNS